MWVENEEDAAFGKPQATPALVALVSLGRDVATSAKHCEGVLHGPLGAADCACDEGSEFTRGCIAMGCDRGEHERQTHLLASVASSHILVFGSVRRALEPKTRTIRTNRNRGPIYPEKTGRLIDRTGRTSTKRANLLTKYRFIRLSPGQGYGTQSFCSSQSARGPQPGDMCS